MRGRAQQRTVTAAAALALAAVLAAAAGAQPVPAGPSAAAPADTVVAAPADTAAVPAVPAPAAERPAAPDTSGVPEPNPQALRVEPAADLWKTGVSPTAAVAMTPLFPGWGQLYAENSWRGALAFGVEMYYWTRMLSKDRSAVRARDFARRFPGDDPNRAYYDAVAVEDWERMRDWAWWSGGVLLIVALDAYVGAHLFHFDEDPVPVPDRWEEQFGPVGGDMPGSRPPLTVTVFRWRKTF